MIESMNQDLIKSITSIVQAASGIVVPVLIIVLGLKINRQLEASKIQLAREKEWRTKWAESFYLAATQFTRSVDEYVCLLSEFAELDGRNDPESNKRRTELDAAAGKEFRVLHRQEWGIRTQLQFAPINEGAVMRAAHAVLAETHKMGTTSKGSFEVVRQHLKEFNKACRDANREMLESS
jgi:hypothetical protein